MAVALLLVFLVLPAIEIAVFIEIGGRLGAWRTILALFVSALAGTALVRAQGMAVLTRARQSALRNEAPLGEVFDGACLVLAGLLFILPGFASDALAFLLLLPPVRWLLRLWAIRRFAASAHVIMEAGGRRFESGPAPVIDGEFHEVDKGKAAPEPPPKLPPRDPPP